MKLEIKRCGTYKNWEGKTFPETFTLFRVEVLRPDSLEEFSDAHFVDGTYVPFSRWERVGKWRFEIHFPSFFPSKESDGAVFLFLDYSKKDGFTLSAGWGKYFLGYSDKTWQVSDYFATGLGG